LQLKRNEQRLNVRQGAWPTYVYGGEAVRVNGKDDEDLIRFDVA